VSMAQPLAPLWLQSSASDLARRIRAGAVTSEAVVTAHLERITAINPALNAVVQRRDDAALADARAADRALADGRPVGPLHGVPLTIKDSFDTAGLVSTGGTLGRRHTLPTTDATIVRRLKAAGAIVIGKTNTPELTLAYEANNLIYGMTRNPYDLSRGTGGSSGGSAAVVAACGSPLDVGSDTAGSIRFPAHCCGVAGLKPTSGRVPRTGHIIGPGGLQQWLTTIGPIARRVEDLELALGIMAGPDDVDPHIVPVPMGRSSAVNLRGLRAALFVDTALASATPHVRDAVTRAAQVLARAGVEVDEATPPAFERPFAFFPQLFGADGAAGLEAYLAFLGTREVSPHVQGAIGLMRPHAMSTAALGDLMMAIDLWRTEALAFSRRYDLIICPVAADVAPVPVTDWNDAAVSWNAGIFPYLVPFNFTGAPSVVVRAGTGPSGLPVGVQCVAQPWRENVALRAAAEVEATLGGWQPSSIAGVA
jgi:amidase